MRNPSALVFAVIAAPLAASAQQPAPVWNGSVRCEIDVKGPGYANHQTHTWTLTGATPPDGGQLDYPGTWNVSGQGSLKFYKFDQTVSLAAGDNIIEWTFARLDCSLDDLTVEGM